MNIKTKSALILLGTLVIGMVLGGLVNARMVDQRIERIGYLRSEPGFVRYWHRAIEPTDEAQRLEIEAVLDGAATRMAEHMRRSRSEARAIMDSTRAELSRVLTEEQMRQLEEARPRLRQRPEHRERRGERRGPPRPGVHSPD
jgi:hypothetical protein